MKKSVFINYLFYVLMMTLACSGCTRLKSGISETKVLEITERIEGDIVYEMGTIQIGDQPKLKLKLKNTLNKPVIINEVRRFCGCTIPEFETAPILPQKSSEVKITFMADHLGIFSKSIKIYLDTQSKPVQLLFRGEVVSKGKNP